MALHLKGLKNAPMAHFLEFERIKAVYLSNIKVYGDIYVKRWGHKIFFKLESF